MTILGLELATFSCCANIGETRVRDLPRFIAKNVRFFEMVGRLASVYRAKYVTCKNAGMRPFFHMGTVCMVFNYINFARKLSRVSVKLHIQLDVCMKVYKIIEIC